MANCPDCIRQAENLPCGNQWVQFRLCETFQELAKQEKEFKQSGNIDCRGYWNRFDQCLHRNPSGNAAGAFGKLVSLDQQPDKDGKRQKENEES